MSSTGPYALVARSMLNGVLLAALRVRDEGGPGLDLVFADPGGETVRYPELCADLLGSGIHHVIGCYTSSSRKEIIPLFEKHDALLWYPSHYEGFERSQNVIYTGAVPNQHLIPLIHYMQAQGRKRAFCLGSNYIWAWETNRVFREEIMQYGGTVLAERYIGVGATVVDDLIAAILAAKPDMVFSTLIGTSAYAFHNGFRAACTAAGIDQPNEIPVASCSLSEPELEAIEPLAVDGHISASVYFSSIASPANAAFVKAHDVAFPHGPAVSADAEASYIATLLLASAIEAAGSDDVAAVRAAVLTRRLQAPQGEVWIDERTAHAALTPRIGRSNRHARFDIVAEAKAPLLADPYLVESAARLEAPRARLRQVS